MNSLSNLACLCLSMTAALHLSGCLENDIDEVDETSSAICETSPDYCIEDSRSLPDFRVEGFTISSNWCSSGTRTYSFRVKNYGNATPSRSSIVTLTEGTATRSASTLNRLAPNASQTFSGSLSAPSAGEFVSTVTADSGRIISESSESNNTSSWACVD